MWADRVKWEGGLYGSISFLREELTRRCLASAEIGTPRQRRVYNVGHLTQAMPFGYLFLLHLFCASFLFPLAARIHVSSRELPERSFARFERCGRLVRALTRQSFRL